MYIHIYICIYIYIYININVYVSAYVCVYMCICLCVEGLAPAGLRRPLPCANDASWRISHVPPW